MAAEFRLNGRSKVFDRAISRHGKAEKNPLLDFTTIGLPQLALAVREELFPMLTETPEVIFTSGAFLANIRRKSPTARPLICLHEILNGPDVPGSVFRHILIHEMIHLVVPGRKVDGEWKAHPPEFWEREASLSPEIAQTWEWLNLNLGPCLTHDRKHECVRVNPGWRRFLALQSRPIEEILKAARRRTAWI